MKLKNQIVKLVNPTDKAKTFAIIAGTVVGLFILYQASDSIMQMLGLKKTKDEVKEEKQQEKVVDETKKQVKDEAKKGNPISYHPAQYVRSAQAIHNATYRSALDDKNEVAISELLRYTPKDVDFYQLQDAYGTKMHYWFGVPVRNRTLIEALQEELSSSEKDRINKAWAGRKMVSRIN
jgi:hypothetical protein